jgi:hypothetical protein
MDKSEVHALCGTVAKPFCIAVFAATDYIRLALRDHFRMVTNLPPTELSVFRRILPLLVLFAAISLTLFSALASALLCIAIMTVTFLLQKRDVGLNANGRAKVFRPMTSVRAIPLVGGAILYYLFGKYADSFAPIWLYLGVLFAGFLSYTYYFIYRIVRTYERRHDDSTRPVQGLLLALLTANYCFTFMFAFPSNGHHDALVVLAIPVISFLELSVSSFTLAICTLVREFHLWKSIWKMSH